MRKLAFCICENKDADQPRSYREADQPFCFHYIDSTISLFPKYRGSLVAWWLMPRTPDPEVGGLSPTQVKPCCVLEQGIFTYKSIGNTKKAVARSNMTEKKFPGTLRINQSTNHFPNMKFQASSHLVWLYSLFVWDLVGNPEVRFSHNEAHLLNG